MTMSNSGQRRPRTDLDRGPSSTFSAHSKTRGGPFVRAAAEERPPSSGEVIPEDSASNVGDGIRIASGSYRSNGRSTVLGKRTERVRETTREQLQVRTRSPAKTDSKGGINGGDMRSRVPSRQTSQAMDGLAAGQAQKASTLRRSY